MTSSPVKSFVKPAGSIIDNVAPTIGDFFLKPKTQFQKSELDKKDQNTLEYFERINEEKSLTEQRVTVQSGRIRFENVILPPDAPKDLICEECETALSSFFCLECSQVPFVGHFIIYQDHLESNAQSQCLTNYFAQNITQHFRSSVEGVQIFVITLG